MHPLLTRLCASSKRFLVYALPWVIVFSVLSSCQDEAVEPITYGTVQGVLRDSRSNLPLANVAISTNPATMALTTDAQGAFELVDIPTGRITITASKVDYIQATASVMVEDGRVTTVAIPLSKSPGATAPNPAVRPSPEDQSTDVSVDPKLEWHPTGASRSDSLRYDVVLYEGNSSSNRRQLLTNSRDTTFQLTGLQYNTVYFWQVTVRNSAGTFTRSSLWSFRTKGLPDNPFLYVRQVSGNTDIYSSDATGGNLIRLTSSPFVEASPRLSPQYDKVAYTSNASGQYRLYTMNRDGSEQRLVSPLPVEGYHNFGVGYCWSPDGSQLLFANNDKLWRVGRDGSGLVLIATAPAGRNFRECDWNLQNNRILVQTVGTSVYDAEIYMMNADGTNMVQLIGNLPGRLDSPSFNPQGTRIIYTRDVDSYMDPTGRQLNAQIFTRNLDGTAEVAVSASQSSSNSGKPVGFNDITPRFSASGSKIIFVQVLNVNQSVPEVWQADTDGRNRARVFANASQPDAKN